MSFLELKVVSLFLDRRSKSIELVSNTMVANRSTKRKRKRNPHIYRVSITRFESCRDHYNTYQTVVKPCKSYDLQGFVVLGLSYNLR